jgi:hypothetical protein
LDEALTGVPPDQLSGLLMESGPKALPPFQVCVMAGATDAQSATASAVREPIVKRFISVTPSTKWLADSARRSCQQKKNENLTHDRARGQMLSVPQAAR